MNRAQLLVSYPKSGNTWLRAVLNSVENQGAAPDLNQMDGTGGIAALEHWVDLGIDICRSHR